MQKCIHVQCSSHADVTDFSSSLQVGGSSSVESRSCQRQLSPSFVIKHTLNEKGKPREAQISGTLSLQQIKRRTFKTKRILTDFTFAATWNIRVGNTWERRTARTKSKERKKNKKKTLRFSRGHREKGISGGHEDKKGYVAFEFVQVCNIAQISISYVHAFQIYILQWTQCNGVFTASHVAYCFRSRQNRIFLPCADGLSNLIGNVIRTIPNQNHLQFSSVVYTYFTPIWLRVNMIDLPDPIIMFTLT